MQVSRIWNRLGQRIEMLHNDYAAKLSGKVNLVAVLSLFLYPFYFLVELVRTFRDIHIKYALENRKFTVIERYVSFDGNVIEPLFGRRRKNILQLAIEERLPGMHPLGGPFPRQLLEMIQYSRTLEGEKRALQNRNIQVWLEQSPELMWADDDTVHDLLFYASGGSYDNIPANEELIAWIGRKKEVHETASLIQTILKQKNLTTVFLQEGLKTAVVGRDIFAINAILELKPPLSDDLARYIERFGNAEILQSFSSCR